MHIVINDEHRPIHFDLLDYGDVFKLPSDTSMFPEIYMKVRKSPTQEYDAVNLKTGYHHQIKQGAEVYKFKNAVVTLTQI